LTTAIDRSVTPTPDFVVASSAATGKLRRQRQPHDLLEDRLHERAAADHDPLAGQVGGLVARLRVDHRLAALAAGDDQRLVRRGDLEPDLGVDRADDRDRDHDDDRQHDDQGSSCELHGTPRARPRGRSVGWAASTLRGRTARGQPFR
jgi:hypothetical protein